MGRKPTVARIGALQFVANFIVGCHRCKTVRRSFVANINAVRGTSGWQVQWDVWTYHSLPAKWRVGLRERPPKNRAQLRGRRRSHAETSRIIISQNVSVANQSNHRISSPPSRPSTIDTDPVGELPRPSTRYAIGQPPATSQHPRPQPSFPATTTKTLRGMWLDKRLRITAEIQWTNLGHFIFLLSLSRGHVVARPC